MHAFSVYRTVETECAIKKTRKWPARKELVPRIARRPVRELLLNSDRILVLTLHIKLGLLM